jgi:hypothetical protein
MPEFEVDPSQNKIRYQIPQVLTGPKVVVEMKMQTDFGDRRIYEGEKVRGECRGPKEQPTCQVEFFALNLATSEARQKRRLEVNRLYADPLNRKMMIDLGNFFSEQQPIGKILSQSNLEVPRLAGRNWKIAYHVGPSRISGELCFYQEAEELSGEYKVGDHRCMSLACGRCNADCDLCGEIRDVTQFGSHFKGQWLVGNGNWGWVDWSFDEQLNFKGYYGFTNEAVRSGAWYGRINGR